MEFMGKQKFKKVKNDAIDIKKATFKISLTIRIVISLILIISQIIIIISYFNLINKIDEIIFFLETSSNHINSSITNSNLSNKTISDLSELKKKYNIYNDVLDYSHIYLKIFGDNFKFYSREDLIEFQNIMKNINIHEFILIFLRFISFLFSFKKLKISIKLQLILEFFFRFIDFYQFFSIFEDVKIFTNIYLIFHKKYELFIIFTFGFIFSEFVNCVKNYFFGNLVFLVFYYLIACLVGYFEINYIFFICQFSIIGLYMLYISKKIIFKIPQSNIDEKTKSQLKSIYFIKDPFFIINSLGELYSNQISKIFLENNPEKKLIKNFENFTKQEKNFPMKSTKKVAQENILENENVQKLDEIFLKFKVLFRVDVINKLLPNEIFDEISKYNETINMIEILLSNPYSFEKSDDLYEKKEIFGKNLNKTEQNLNQENFNQIKINQENCFLHKILVNESKTFMDNSEINMIGNKTIQIPTKNEKSNINILLTKFFQEFSNFFNFLVNELSNYSSEDFYYLGNKTFKNFIPNNLDNYHEFIEKDKNFSNNIINDNKENDIDYEIYLRLDKFSNQLEIHMRKSESKLLEKLRIEQLYVKENKILYESIFSNIMNKIYHEINNPTLNIIEITKILKESISVCDSNKNFIKFIKEIKYLANGINFTLSDLKFLNDVVFIRYNPNELIKEVQQKISKIVGIVDISKQIRKMIKIFQKKISNGNKNIQLITNVENVPKKLKINENYFNLILYNLISNSLKFSNSGPITINVKFDSEKYNLLIEIIDNGIGIHEEYLEKITQLFYKLDNSNNIYGTGYGLFAVKLISTALNGNFWIESQFGKGTQISLELNFIEEPYHSNFSKAKNESIYRINNDNVCSEKNEQNLSNIREKDKSRFIHQSSLKSYLNFLNTNFYSSCLNKSETRKINRILSTKNQKNNYYVSMFHGKNKIFDDKAQLIKCKTNLINEKNTKNKIKRRMALKISDLNILNIFYKNFSNQIENLDLTIPTNKSFENMTKTSSYNRFSITKDSKIEDFVFNGKNQINKKDHLNNYQDINADLNKIPISYNIKISQNSQTKNTNRSLFIESENTQRKSKFSVIPNSCNIFSPEIKQTTINNQVERLLKQRNLEITPIIMNSTRKKSESSLHFNYKHIHFNSDNSRHIILNNIELISDMKHKLDNRNDSLETLVNNQYHIRILVVDDEDLIRLSHINLIKKYCQKEDIRVFLDDACDGAECLFKLFLGYSNGLKYDFLFIDETMSFISGLLTATVIKKLTKQNIIGDIKIIMITSYDSNIIEKSDKDKSIDLILSKPLSNSLIEGIFSTINLVK